MLKNAIAYILRKRNRTIIVFIFLTVVLSCLYSCLNITKSTSNLENNLYKISNTSLSIIKNNGDTFETNQFKELDNIKEIKEHTYKIVKETKKEVKEREVTFEELLNNSSLSELKAYRESLNYFKCAETIDEDKTEYDFPISKTTSLRLKKVAH